MEAVHKVLETLSSALIQLLKVAVGMACLRLKTEFRHRFLNKLGFPFPDSVVLAMAAGLCVAAAGGRAVSRAARWRCWVGLAGLGLAVLCRDW